MFYNGNPIWLFYGFWLINLPKDSQSLNLVFPSIIIGDIYAKRFHSHVYVKKFPIWLVTEPIHKHIYKCVGARCKYCLLKMASADRFRLLVWNYSTFAKSIPTGSDQPCVLTEYGGYCMFDLLYIYEYVLFHYKSVWHTYYMFWKNK